MDIRHPNSFKVLVVTTAFAVLGMTLASQTYYIDKFTVHIQDHRCTNTFATCNTTTKSQCALLCCRYSTCFGFNYKKSSKICQLVAGLTDLNNVTYDVGFSVYKTTRPTDGYIDVGGHVIALQTKELTNARAAALCAPSGRLIRIDTYEKFYTIANYLEARMSTEISLRNVWTDGYFNNEDATYRFSDGSPIPLSGNLSVFYADANQNCIRMGYKDANGYRLRDIGCFNRYAYICELY